MTNRLALLEFVNYKNIGDFRGFVASLCEDFKQLEESIKRLDTTNIDVYAPEGVRARLREDAKNNYFYCCNNSYRSCRSFIA